MASALAGLGSSMDINSIISKLMTVERAPLDNLAKRTQKFQSELSAFGVVKGAMSNLQSAAAALAGQADSRPVTASSSDSAIASVSAQAGATASNHDIEIIVLAQAQKLYGPAYAESNASLGSGILKIEFGSTVGRTFVPKSNDDTLSITIPSDKTGLSDIRDAINAAHGGVSAAIVNDGTGYRLVLTASESGAANGMRVSVTEADGNGAGQNDDCDDNDDNGNGNNGQHIAVGLSALAFDPVAAHTGLEVARPAQDAVFTLDGLRMTRPSNTVSDAVSNLTLTLNKTGGAKISLAEDTGAGRSALDNMVKAYNSAVSTLKSLTKYDETTRTGSILLGESTVRNLQSQMRSVINGVYGNNTDSRRTLSSLGLSLQGDGTLSVNNSRYSAALGAAPDQTGRVINGAAKALSAMLDKALDSEGLLATRTSGIQSSIRQISDQQSRIESRMSAIEARYRAQFTALESLVSTMTSTNSYLSSQFESLKNNN